MEFQWTEINGVKLIARRFYLEALTKAHDELVLRGIGVAGKIGFVPSGSVTASWRSLKLQKQLVAKGASKTLLSNHRRGVAVDCYPDRPYTERIRPVMEKNNLVNDLRPWDAVHWNYKSNKHSWGYKMVDSLPPNLKEFSMQEYDNYFIQDVQGDGGFALVYGGKKHIVNTKKKKNRLAEANATAFIRGMTPAALTKEAWDSIPTGEDF